jgi:endonuclease YncB( thermonuclease family)
MTGSPSPALAKWRQAPRWQRVTLVMAAALLLLIILAAVSGPSTKDQKRSSAGSVVAATTTTTTSLLVTTTTSTVPVVTITEVADGRTIVGSDGKQVQIAALAEPGPCWADPAVDFTKNTLVGKEVRFVVQSGGAVSVLLPDGTDFAVLAVGRGVTRTEAAASGALATAQNAAKLAGLGLWGTPCHGLDTLPPPPPPPVPTTKIVAPEPPPPAPPAQGVYYPNCAAAKAAGAAPLHVGQPGYRKQLDRDGDGVACEA